MSKSISGSGSLNLTVQELRFLEIKATLITAINATIDNLLTAVNANFTGLVTITNLTISESVTVENMTVLENLTAQYITANQGITGDLTGAVNIETTTPTNTGGLRIPFIDGATPTTSSPDGLLTSSHKLRFDESTGTLIISNYVSVPILAVTTYAMITPTTSTEDEEYKVAMFGNGNELTGDSMTYNCFENRLTVPNLQVTGGLEITPATSTADIGYEVAFFGLNNALTGDTTMTFNPLDTRLTVADLQITNDITIQALNNTTAGNSRIPFINGDSTDTGVLVSRGNFNYNTSSQTLNCGTFNGTLNGSVANAVTIGTQDITISGNTTINSKDVTSTNQLCRLLFLDGDSNIGTNYDIVRDDFLYYIPNSTLLVGNSIRSQVQTITPLLVLLGANNSNGRIDIYDDGTAVRNRYFHPNGHLFVDGNVINSNKLIMTNTAQTRIYNELQCDDVLTLNSVPIVPTTSNTDILLLDSATNQISKSGLTFNATGGVLSTANITLTGAISSAIVNTTDNATIGGNLGVEGNADIEGILTVATLNVGTQSITDFEVSGDLTLTNLPSTVTTGFSYSLLYKNNTTDEVHETPPEVYIGRLTDVYIGTERIIADTFQCGNGLPINYTCTYHCFDWKTYDETAAKPHGTFGLDYFVELHTTNTSGHNPTVTQHGANIYGTYFGTVVRSAINFGQDGSDVHWNLASNAYAGIWKVRVSCVFQNLTILRQTPKIYLKKYTGSTWIEQPHISTAIAYARHDVGELVTLNLEGVVYLSSSSELLRIYTLLETHDVGNPPTWPDSITDWAGRDINIQMEFLGTGTATTGEIVNAL